MRGRIDLFWLAAGGLLTLFGANEIVAYVEHPVPRWLGGPLALAGEIAAVVVGLGIGYGLGIRETLPVVDPVARGDAEGQSERPLSVDLPPPRGSVSQSTWLRSSTNSRP